MANADPEENPLYSRAEDLHPRHWASLARRPPEEAARAAGGAWDGEGFALPVLGRTLRVVPPTRRLSFVGEPGRRVGYQRALVVVAYLAGAVEAPPRGEWLSPRQLPGGEAFFRGPHSVATPQLGAAFGAEPGRLVAAARGLGGGPEAGGDAAAVLPALPRVPFKVLLWGASEEFDASAQLLVDARAHLHLPLDVLWALTNVTIADLLEEGQ